ncbi:MAG: citrate lyase subunit alpha [Spirochaetales bacterium]|jgi:citrate lyase subunit alpha/citrate CoA-transferase|nr:citrate lyase subunit alpha [Spirochaetales bacterium]
MTKVAASLEEALIACGLKSGMVISFHHHLRNGDYVLNKVLEAVAKLGIGDLTVNASSIFDAHAPLLTHIKNGLVTGIETNYISPLVGRAISGGILKKPVIFRSHGTRPSDIETGKSPVDVAFIAAPSSDKQGNCSGKTGKSACGALGYAFADAMYAKKTVVVTDNLVEYPLRDFSISEIYVDHVAVVDAIGDPQGIVSGTTRMTRDPVALRIADLAARVISASGLLKDGFSFQTGAGGASLAVGRSIQRIMLEKGIKGSFALGGTTGYLVEMLEAGCFESILDVQCFDLKAVESLHLNPRHVEISASHYASPTAKSTAAQRLDAVVLGATQIDVDFNVNVHTDSNGYIIGGSGGHSDVAAGAKLAIVAAPLSRARLPIVVDRALTITTPGKTIDVLVTQCGVAVNPRQEELRQRLAESGLPLTDIEDLRKMAEGINGVPQKPKLGDRVVARVKYRDGAFIDEILQTLPDSRRL